MRVMLIEIGRLFTFRVGLKGLLRTSFYTNSCYLVADVAVGSLLGFVFWTLSARLYSPAQVGLASATVAAVILLSRLSTLGFGYGLIRFLSGAGERTKPLINSCFTIAGLVSLTASLIFLSGLKIWSPALLYLRHPGLAVFFVSLILAYTLFLLTEQVFIAGRQTKFVLFKNSTAGVAKIALAVVLVATFSSFGILFSWGLAILAALAIVLLWFLPRMYSGYAPIPTVNRGMLNDIIHFSLGNYVAELLWLAPLMLFPLLVINTLGAEMNAYFYIPWVIGQMVFAIPIAISYSLFAEGSYDEWSLRSNTQKAAKLCLMILVPVVIALFVLSDRLLLLFGSSYSENGAALLRILALSTFPLAINYICLSAMRVKKNTRGVMLVSVSIACLALVPGYMLMTNMGLLGIGTAWIATQILVAVAVTSFLFHRHRRSTATAT